MVSNKMSNLLRNIIDVADSFRSIAYNWAPDYSPYAEEVGDQLDALSKELDSLHSIVIAYDSRYVVNAKRTKDPVTIATVTEFGENDLALNFLDLGEDKERLLQEMLEPECTSSVRGTKDQIAAEIVSNSDMGPYAIRADIVSDLIRDMIDEIEQAEDAGLQEYGEEGRSEAQALRGLMAALYEKTGQNVFRNV